FGNSNPSVRQRHTRWHHVEHRFGFDGQLLAHPRPLAAPDHRSALHFKANLETKDRIRRRLTRTVIDPVTDRHRPEADQTQRALRNFHASQTIIIQLSRHLLRTVHDPEILHRDTISLTELSRSTHQSLTPERHPLITGNSDLGL